MIFQCFGLKTRPKWRYAAVIPKFVMQLMNYESPIIKWRWNYSRDFTYIDNVIQMNELAMLTENQKPVIQFIILLLAIELR